MSQVVAVLQFIPIIPATNAGPTSERSFSALRHLKSYLRSTTQQERLNYLMLLDVHKKRTDALDMQAVLTEFIGESEHRIDVASSQRILFEQNDSDAIWCIIIYNCYYSDLGFLYRNVIWIAGSVGGNWINFRWVFAIWNVAKCATIGWINVMICI